MSTHLSQQLCCYVFVFLSFDLSWSFYSYYHRFLLLPIYYIMDYHRFSSVIIIIHFMSADHSSLISLDIIALHSSLFFPISYSTSLAPVRVPLLIYSHPKRSLSNIHLIFLQILILFGGQRVTTNQSCAIGWALAITVWDLAKAFVSVAICGHL